jgi:hypothetical protein
MQRILHWKKTVNRMRIQVLRFADGIAIIAQDEINLKRALESIDDILKSNYKMKKKKKKRRKLWFAPKILKILILKWMMTPQSKYKNSST